MYIYGVNVLFWLWMYMYIIIYEFYTVYVFSSMLLVSFVANSHKLAMGWLINCPVTVLIGELLSWRLFHHFLCIGLLLCPSCFHQKKAWWNRTWIWKWTLAQDSGLWTTFFFSQHPSFQLTYRGIIWETMDYRLAQTTSISAAFERLEAKLKRQSRVKLKLKRDVKTWKLWSLDWLLPGSRALLSVSNVNISKLYQNLIMYRYIVFKYEKGIKIKE